MATVKRSLARISILFLICTSTITLAEEEENSFMDVAQSLLQESLRNQKGGSGLDMLSGVVQGFMQSEGGKQLGDILTKMNNHGAVDLVSNLASIWQASKFNFQTDDGSSSQQGLNIDPSIVGSMMDLFSSLSKASNDADNNNVDENNNDHHATKKRKAEQQESSTNWDTIMSLVGPMLSSMSNSNNNGGSAGGLESFLSFLPVLMSSLGGQHNTHFSSSIPHHDHPQFLPPILENLHEYWDHFLKSDFGKSLWQSSGMTEITKTFTNEKGEIDTERVLESLENNTFRRKWIKSISNFIAQWTKHLGDPEVQKSYLQTGQVICNGFLAAQGYPKETLLNLDKPAASISALTNAVFKRQLGLKIDSKGYVEPVVGYIQELFKSAHNKGSGILQVSPEEIQSRLSTTMDSEIIEPILRVNRAYKFGLRRPECVKYVMCTVNQPSEAIKSGIKPAVTKISSLGASWFISNYGTSSFWELYSAAVEEKSCKHLDRNCSDFHVEDIKATTEYYHNEL